MVIREIDKLTWKILSVGASLVTLIVITGSVTDPINSTKLFVLGPVAFSALGISLLRMKTSRQRRVTSFQFILMAFIIWAATSSIFSNSPFTQNFYGVYGRNTGLLTYFCLAVLAFSASLNHDSRGLRLVIYSFIFSGTVNLIYGFWVTFFGDFISWNNPYGALLGTFGNPNFISSFFGMFFTVLLAFMVNSGTKIRILVSIALISISYQLTKTESIQGIVLASIGCLIVGLFWLRSKTESNLLLGSTAFLAITSGLLSGLGALGFGPLANLLTQPTLNYRLQYWFAGWKMGFEHPVFGVGMDSYGDWYRESRGPLALKVPGKDVVTNVAHNVTLDLFSYGGFPLLGLYLLLNMFAIVNLYRFVKRSVTFMPIHVATVGLWLTYQAQAIISINQIGLAVWGWLLTGIIAGPLFSNTSTDSKSDHRKDSKNTPANILLPSIIAPIGLLVGTVIAIPPMSSDIIWVKSLRSGQLDQLEKALEPKYFSPKNSARMAEAVRTLEQSNLPSLALKYARQAVIFNPRYTDAWRLLYFATNATEADKTRAKAALIRLDPLNDDWKDLN